VSWYNFNGQIFLKFSKLSVNTAKQNFNLIRFMIQQWIEHLKNYLRDDISKVKEMKQ
jgi:hypothetical protein